MLDIAGRREKGHPLAVTDAAQVRHRIRCRRPCQLGEVATGEPCELVGVMTVPAAELAARGGVLQPLIEGGVPLLDAPRPQAVDEHSGAARVTVVDPVNLERRPGLAAT